MKGMGMGKGGRGATDKSPEGEGGEGMRALNAGRKRSGGDKSCGFRRRPPTDSTRPVRGKAGVPGMGAAVAVETSERWWNQ